MYNASQFPSFRPQQNYNRMNHCSPQTQRYSQQPSFGCGFPPSFGQCGMPSRIIIQPIIIGQPYNQSYNQPSLPPDAWNIYKPQNKPQTKPQPDMYREPEKPAKPPEKPVVNNDYGAQPRAAKPIETTNIKVGDILNQILGGGGGAEDELNDILPGILQMITVEHATPDEKPAEAPKTEAPPAKQQATAPPAQGGDDLNLDALIPNLLKENGIDEKMIQDLLAANQ